MYFNNGKYNIFGGNLYQGGNGTAFISRGKVISTEDPDDAGRIKVRIIGVDNDEFDKEVSYAFPMLPKHINIVPKIKEAVLIFSFGGVGDNTDRLYLGPIIPQPQNLNNAEYDIEAWNAFSFARQEMGPAPFNRKKLKGGYPKKEDIALQGRRNVDVILKDDELLLRAGKFVYKGDLADNSRNDDEFDDKLDCKFNSRTQGYFQIKYNAQINVTENDDDNKEYGTVTNIVSNKINLLTHKEGNPRFNLTNQDNLISDEEMQKILTEAHPLVFGDKALEFLKLVKNAISNHTHKFAGIPPHAQGSSATAKVIQDMNEYNLEELLSKNIRIN